MSTQIESAFTNSVLPMLTIDENDCWIFGGAKHNGYGVAWTGAETAKAHRLSYERFIEPIPAGLTLDHLCRNRACCNPFHLEPVTRGENTLRGFGPCAMKARQTHCAFGHELAGDNLMPYDLANGRRRCRICRNAKQRIKRNGNQGGL